MSNSAAAANDNNCVNSWPRRRAVVVVVVVALWLKQATTATVNLIKITQLLLCDKAMTIKETTALPRSSGREAKSSNSVALVEMFLILIVAKTRVSLLQRA